MRQQVAGLLIQDHRLLLCLRSATRAYYPGVWDLPGGHVEPGESDEGALRRELDEELGITMLDCTETPFARIIDGNADFDLRLWLVRTWRGKPQNCCSAEHDRISWFAPDDIVGLPLALPEYTNLFARVIAESG